MKRDSADCPGGPAQAEADVQWPKDYLEYFRLFNEGQYFEAHEALERLWLPVRGSTVADFYKGLIQVAGAFVHWQKDRHGPAVALLKLARANLARYPEDYLGVEVHVVLSMLGRWQDYLTGTGGTESPPACPPKPVLNPKSFGI